MKLGTRAEVFAAADIIAQARTPAAPTPIHGGRPRAHAARPNPHRFRRPADLPRECVELARAGVSFFAMELVPRITRAQSMDALSSMASIAGYEAVLMAAATLPKMFPMMMTAAGTITPAKVLVLGAGVAGLQAIATARRLGAVVSAYDVRSAVKEQIESLGAKFVVLDLEIAGEGQGRLRQGHGRSFLQTPARTAHRGHQRAGRRHYHRRRARAAKRPFWLPREMAEAMAPGSVIVDIAAERGGNCELTARRRNRRPSRRLDRWAPSTCLRARPITPARCTPPTSSTCLKPAERRRHSTSTATDEIIRETLVTHRRQTRQPARRAAHPGPGNPQEVASS